MWAQGPIGAQYRARVGEQTAISSAVMSSCAVPTEQPSAAAIWRNVAPWSRSPIACIRRTAMRSTSPGGVPPGRLRVVFGIRANAAGPSFFCVARLRARRSHAFLPARFRAAAVVFVAIVHSLVRIRVSDVVLVVASSVVRSPRR